MEGSERREPRENRQCGELVDWAGVRHDGAMVKSNSDLARVLARGPKGVDTTPRIGTTGFRIWSEGWAHC